MYSSLFSVKTGDTFVRKFWGMLTFTPCSVLPAITCNVFANLTCKI